MKRLLWIAVVAAGTLIGTSALAEQGSASVNFGVGSVPPAHYPWEEEHGIRPTFGGSVQTEPNAGHWFETLGRPASSHAPREGRIQPSRPVSVRSVEDRSSEVLSWFDALGR